MNVTDAELKSMAAELLDCNCISMLAWSGTDHRDTLPTVKTLCKILGVSSPSEFARQKVQAFEARKAEAKQPIGRNDTVKAIKEAFKARGLRYSVTTGRGTSWGWIHIDLLPASKSLMTEEQRRAAYAKMGTDLGLDRVAYSSEGIPASSDYYREYIDRAKGLSPVVTGKPYWD